MSERIRQKPIEQQIQDEGFDPRKGIQFLQQVIVQAHDISRGLRSSISPEVKDSDPNQVVTEIDRQVGKMIIQEIQTRYTHHGIIDEEAGVIEGKSPFVWTIDPVDGTAYLASGDTRWGTMVGLLYDGMPIGGAFSLPIMDEGITVFSMEGVGVFITEGDKTYKRASLSSHLNLRQSIVDFGTDTYFTIRNGEVFPDREKNDRMALLRARIQENVRKLESGGNPYGWVQMIRGVYGGSLCYTSSKIWDRVPVHHAIVALGGVVTEFDGSPIDYKSAIDQGIGVMEEKFGVCAAVNPALHQALQTIIHANRHLWENL